jgi:hypothetical protein
MDVESAMQQAEREMDEMEYRGELVGGRLTPDPRNPQPGQVWQRRVVNIRGVTWPVSVKVVCATNDGIKALMLFSDTTTGKGPITRREWRRWACPWWRRRKHWAKCVEWKEDGR